MPALPLEGLRIVSFESRRAKEMEALIQKQGGIPFVAPSLREIPLEENPKAFEFAAKLFRREIDALILLTGVGTRTLIGILKTRYPLAEIISELKSIPLVARGPKPKAALAEINLKPTFMAPEPNTWREILTVFDRELPVQGKRIAVQEYGISNLELIAELKKRGADVFSFPVYRWAFPHNPGPMQEAIQRIIRREADVVLWTNAQQIYHVLEMARKMEAEKDFSQAMSQCFIASIGPTMTEALQENGFSVDFEPSQTKMGVFVLELAQQVERIKGMKGKKREV
jgi:uroporphyrinogen-III synthase